MPPRSRRKARRDKTVGVVLAGVGLLTVVALALIVAPGFFPYYGFAKGAFLLVLMIGFLIGVHQRSRLKKNIEDEFTKGSVSLRRKIFLLSYEGLFLIILVLCLSSLTAMITYETIAWSSVNPFDRTANLAEVFVFFFDQALKGAFYDIVRVYDVALPGVLIVDGRKHAAFAAFIVIFRWVSSFILIAGVTLLLYRLFVKRRPVNVPPAS